MLIVEVFLAEPEPKEEAGNGNKEEASTQVVFVFVLKAGSPLGGKMSRWKNFLQSVANQIVAAVKCQATNSRNTFYFSRLNIFPPSGDPA